jgi:hypothetical protein
MRQHLKSPEHESLGIFTVPVTRLVLMVDLGQAEFGWVHSCLSTQEMRCQEIERQFFCAHDFRVVYDKPRK